MHDFTINAGSNLPDLHNRRDNINVVADDCKRNNYPLIAWPEDKELLRLGDLPKFVKPNTRPTWEAIASRGSRVVSSDQDLRDYITEGCAYSIQPGFEQFNHSVVVHQWAIKTRDVATPRPRRQWLIW